MKKTNTDLALNGNNQPEVADIFHVYGENYRKYNPVSYEQRKAMHHIEVCVPPNSAATSSNATSVASSG